MDENRKEWQKPELIVLVRFLCDAGRLLSLDPLGFGPRVVSTAEPWESVRDASPSLAQATGFTDPVADGKGYELPSTALRTGLRLMKGADKWHIRKRLSE